MMDVTFGAGHECDTRIVIYDNAKQSYDRVSNKETAVKFASINNNCGVLTYIVNAALFVNRQENKIDLIGNIKASPEIGYSTDYPRLPTKEQFEQAEFWLYFDEYGDPSQEMIYDPDWWFGGPMTYFIEGIIGVTPIWCGDGFYVQVTADNFQGHQMLIELIENKRNIIEQHFDKYELKIKREPDSPIEITVKFDDRPFKEFTLMSVEEKSKHIVKYQNLMDELSGFLYGELFENIHDENQKAVGASIC